VEPFFRARLLHGSGAEAAVLCGVDIYVKSGSGVDPYIQLPMSKSSDGWQKVWFLIWNNADALLPIFIGSHPIPQLNLGYIVARRDLHRMQPLRVVIEQLLREGLMGADLLWTFLAAEFNRSISERQPCGCIWGHVVPTVPSKKS
jgi:hypothetical protein